MSSPPTKRKRTEGSQITRSESIWIPDGNVVLQAGNTQFRVNWGTVCYNSSVFRAMEIPSELPEELIVEGCPVLELSDDPEDVEYLLKALYNPTFHSQKTLPLPVVRALIRLGRKYKYEGLHDSAVARVTAQCPTTLEEYDLQGVAIEWYDGLEFDMITLIRESSIWPALPSACYRAVHMTTLKELFVGILRRDGTSKRNGTRASLSPEDLQKCAGGREKLLVKQFEPGYTFGWVRKWEHTDCTSPVVCGKARDDILKNHVEDFSIRALDLSGWLSRTEFCAACTRHAIESMTAGRKKVWQELPEIFDLHRWKKLKNGV